MVAYLQIKNLLLKQKSIIFSFLFYTTFVLNNATIFKILIMKLVLNCNCRECIRSLYPLSSSGNIMYLTTDDRPDYFWPMSLMINLSHPLESHRHTRQPLAQQAVFTWLLMIAPTINRLTRLAPDSWSIPDLSPQHESLKSRENLVISFPTSTIKPFICTSILYLK